MNIKKNAFLCTYFTGYKPCIFQKKGKISDCDQDCPFKILATHRILIIKKGAMGEVLRCTSLLRKIRKKYPQGEVWWITDYPDLLNKEWVNKILPFNWESYLILKSTEFDIIYSLDKDTVCCSLAKELKAKTKKGFTVENGKIFPYDKDAYYLWKRGINDNFMKQDKRHYIEEIFEVCGLQFEEEEYILPPYKIPKVEIDKSRLVVGLNTGTSSTWKTRLWRKENWIKLAELLIKEGIEVILLGGPDEHKQNQKIAEASGAKYFGVYPIREFIGLISLIDIIVTQVTFTFHVAIGLKKKIVLMNNIFNKNEFYFYKLPHIILEPPLTCKACYKYDFDEFCQKKYCMDLIKPSQVFEGILKLKNKEVDYAG